MSTVRILASGVDTLYLSAKGQLYDGLLGCLKDMRELNPDKDIPFSFHRTESDTILRPYGRRGYKFLLTSPAFDLSLGAAEQFPDAVIELRSHYIHSVGLEMAVDQITELLTRDYFPHGVRLMASRVDVFADQQGWTPQLADFDRFVTRAVCKTGYTPSTEIEKVHEEFSGFRFGKGDVVARVYNKTLQMGHETWPELLWNGRIENEAVWRLEFQFRREALKELRVDGPEDVLRHRQGLWQYGLRWVSLRKRTKDQTRSRWEIADEWQQLKDAALGGVASPLIREHIRNTDVGRLTQGLVGFATALEALGESRGLGGVVVRQVPAVNKYLTHKGTTFAEIVTAKRQQMIELDPALEPNSSKAVAR